MSKVYYNENDAKTVSWLKELINQGCLPDGDIDERSICDIQATELVGYKQCHFFAGVGGWPLAIAQAGWGDRPVWTGSCPCQPFSVSGKRKGKLDERHLWPVWFNLISQLAPDTIFGEQVASKDALSWLDDVQNDLEREDYAFSALDLCASGIGAPHIRQRLYWVANKLNTFDKCLGGRLGNAETWGEGGRIQRGGEKGRNERTDRTTGKNGTLSRFHNRKQFQCPGPTNGFWGSADWLLCRDGRWRPVEPGTFPLAHGIPARVGRLRGYGNAIVVPLAIEFVKAFMEINNE
jgi:DNA (cytosine-5)-methyltransferase 1